MLQKYKLIMNTTLHFGNVWKGVNAKDYQPFHYLSIYLSINQFNIYLSIYLTICLSICPSYYPNYKSILHFLCWWACPFSVHYIRGIKWCISRKIPPPPSWKLGRPTIYLTLTTGWLVSMSIFSSLHLGDKEVYLSPRR